MNGNEIAELLLNWADKKRIHPDDFDTLFVEELIGLLREDN